MMLMMNAQREQYLGMIKGVGDFMNLMIDVDDPVRRKALFQRLWKEVVDSSVQIQLDKERAKIETLHDTLAAHLQACLKSLEDSDESSFD